MLKRAFVRKRLLMLVNDAAFFASHRLPVALAARDAGYDVHVATAPGEAASAITAHGLAHYPLAISRGGTNLFREMHSFLQVMNVIRRVRPEIVHLATVKPVLYGGIAARLLDVPAVVAAITGLGHVFAVHDVRTRTVRALVSSSYRLALNRERLKVIFQNCSDRSTLMRIASLSSDQVVTIRGSGVDLSAYRFTPEPDGVPVVTLAARLLRPKGVCEFVAAAELLHARGVNARFQLVGSPDPGNASSVTPGEIERWRGAGIIEVAGYRRDIAAIFAASNIVVLPSYYGEGLPKVLLEAAACGRAIITTDMPGCRDAIEPGKTGVLIPPRDAVALAEAIESLLADAELRREMGVAGRTLAEREYAVEMVIAQHLEIYQSLCGG